MYCHIKSMRNIVFIETLIIATKLIHLPQEIYNNAQVHQSLSYSSYIENYEYFVTVVDKYFSYPQFNGKMANV